MLVWQAYTKGFTHVGHKQITGQLVIESFEKFGIKSCELQNIFHYLNHIECDQDCKDCLRRYLNSEVGQQMKKYGEVKDEFGEVQLRLW